MSVWWKWLSERDPSLAPPVTDVGGQHNELDIYSFIIISALPAGILIIYRFFIFLLLWNEDKYNEQFMLDVLIIHRLTWILYPFECVCVLVDSMLREWNIII